MSGQVANGSRSPKPTHHYGRGGAGNVVAKPKEAPAGEPVTTPTLKSKMYTTGRGGQGNIARNDDPNSARVAQDVDIPGIILSEGPHHVGRGGAANTETPNDAERLAAKEHNERVRSESFKSSSRERASAVKAIANKAKNVVTGKD